MDWVEGSWKAASVCGLLLLVVAYLQNQRGRLAAWSATYLVMNAAGAFLLAAYSWFIGEWVFVALEGFWSGASILALVRGPPQAG